MNDEVIKPYMGGYPPLVQKMEMEYKMVVVVRADLRLTPGKMAVQVAHAAVNCALASRKKKSEWFDAWYQEGQKKVVIKVPSLNDLYALKMQAEDAGLTNSLIIDAGLTELPPGTTTCLGIGPGPNALVDSITGDLKLM